MEYQAEVRFRGLIPKICEYRILLSKIMGSAIAMGYEIVTTTTSSSTVRSLISYDSTLFTPTTVSKDKQSHHDEHQFIILPLEYNSTTNIMVVVINFYYGSFGI